MRLNKLQLECFRRLQSAAGTSYRSNGSTRTGSQVSLFFGHTSSSTTRNTDMICVSQDGRNAEKDGGSSFVVSPQQQLYRLHVRSVNFISRFTGCM